MQPDSTTLREYQQQLFDRIRASGGSEAASSYLGFEAGEKRWVVPLTDVIEVLPVPPLVSTPLTAEWFVGVANVRGSLFAVTDFSRFATDMPVPITSESRLVLLHAQHRVQAGLLVSRSLGLRQLKSVPNATAKVSSWQSVVHVDADPRPWHELNVQELTRDPRFLRVGV